MCNYKQQKKDPVEGEVVCARNKHKQPGGNYKLCLAPVGLAVADENDPASPVGVVAEPSFGVIAAYVIVGSRMCTGSTFGPAWRTGYSNHLHVPCGSG